MAWVQGRRGSEKVNDVMNRKRLFTAVTAAACLMGGLVASAQMPPPGPGTVPPGSMPPSGMGAGSMPQGSPLTVHQLTPSVYWAEGGIGNVGIIVGETGVVVVDTTISTTSAQELLSKVAKITSKPVKAVVLTHGDIDHVSGLGAFPADITIIAQQNTRNRIQSGVAAGRSRVPADHVPNHAVVDRETLDIAGVRLQLLHWAPAHTDGDLVVYVPSQKVVFTGDIFALDQPRPLIHTEQNGTSAGWVATARGIVSLQANQFVVGHGDVQSKASLKRRVDQAVTEIASIKKLVARGATLEQIEVAVDDPPKGFVPVPGPRFEPFARVVYGELTHKH